MRVLSIHIKPIKGHSPLLEASAKVSIDGVGTFITYDSLSQKLIERIYAEVFTASQQKLATLTAPANFDFRQLGQAGQTAPAAGEVEHA